MLTNEDAKFWGPLPEILNNLASCVPENARVLEIGPGTVPFPRATHFVDETIHSPLLAEKVPPENLVLLDAQENPLPFPDKYFDFIYCRHVVEDMLYPFNFLNEMSRVGKAGYIETPSVIAELCRGIDGGSPPWRGYHHHHWFVANDNGTLKLIKKFPVVEYRIAANEDSIAEILRQSPFQWNTYLLWEGSIAWEHVKLHPASEDYPAAILNAAARGYESTNKFIGSQIG